MQHRFLILSYEVPMCMDVYTSHEYVASRIGISRNLLLLSHSEPNYRL